MTYKSLVMRHSGIYVVRYNLEHTSAPHNLITDTITPLWKKYEPWATYNDVSQTVTRKTGRVIDIAYDETGDVMGVYIFRIFQYGLWRIMFRGNSYSSLSIRGVGSSLLRLTLKQYYPDKLITFTSQDRVYAFLSYFGEILPTMNKSPDGEELRLLSQLAGRSCKVDERTLIVKDFYYDKHVAQGSAVRNKYVHDLFTKLGRRDAYALIVRCK